MRPIRSRNLLTFLSRSTSEKNCEESRVQQKVEEIMEISGSLSRLIGEKAAAGRTRPMSSADTHSHFLSISEALLAGVAI